VDDRAPLAAGRESEAALEPAAAHREVVRPRVDQVRVFTARHRRALSAVALIAVIVTSWAVLRGRSVAVEPPVGAPTWSQPAAAPSASAQPVWLVHVLGAVGHPGVVTVPAGARVRDAISAAGGMTADADPGELNLAATLTDGCQVIIGTVGAPRGEVRVGAETTAGGGGPSVAGTINLNQASAEQLDTLPGVGPVTAQAILAWREASGPFTSVAQLQEVDGIGPATFARIEPHVSV
jgi:competence protein ComEA